MILRMCGCLSPVAIDYRYNIHPAIQYTIHSKKTGEAATHDSALVQYCNKRCRLLLHLSHTLCTAVVEL